MKSKEKLKKEDSKKMNFLLKKGLIVKMDIYKRKKLNKILLIIALVMIVILIIAIILYINFTREEEIIYEDKISAKNYFEEIVVDLETKEVTRDDIDTSWQNEFEISEEQANLLLSSVEEITTFFSGTTFEVGIQEQNVYIKNPYQTKKIIVETDSLINDFEADNVQEIQEGLYILQYDTQMRTQSAYEYLKNQTWVKNIELDKVEIIDIINDESQTVYGEAEEETEYNSYGVEEMGFDNYKNIVNENGNPSEITVATIGYGMQIEHSYFYNRIDEKYYNYIEQSKQIYETIPQGSRIAEVIVESTSENVKIMPLMVINSENYTTLATILEALSFAINNSDVICYEFTNEENYMINLVLENAFRENVPVCCVTIPEDEEEIKTYPANSSLTIGVSSINKESQITSYSGQGEYIDFSAYSTDVKEIFDTNTSVSRWSGAQYSNAHIVAAIALVKTYNKEYTILEVYNILRNYCVDLGDEGKDIEYGYGCPDFSDITIADIDKIVPEIQEIKYDNENWEIKKQIQIIASDNIKINGWSITNSENTPDEWNEIEEVTPSIDQTTEIEENGTYYIWIRDSAGNIAYQSIEVNRVDNNGPDITYTIDNSKLETEKYVTITTEAKDEQSGLAELPYSWDGENWSLNGNTLKVTDNGRFTIYAKDKVGNISEQEIVIDDFEQEGEATIGDGEIIQSISVSSSWNGDINNSVRISFTNNINIVGWRITENNQTPSAFNTVENNLDAEDEENNTLSNNTNSINTNSTNTNSNNTAQDNSILNNTITNTTLEENSATSRYPSVTVTVALKANTTYYAWVKEENGNITYQTFTVSKVEI